MVVPSFFWLGVALAVFFEKPLIVEEIMLPVDRVSSILTLIIMGGLPLITILVNIKSLFQVEYSPHNENVLVNMHVKKNFNQWALIIYAGLCLAGLFTWAFFEHFKFFSEQNIY